MGEEETVMIHSPNGHWKEFRATFEPQHYYKPVGKFAKEVFELYFLCDNIMIISPLEDDKFLRERLIPCFKQLLTLGWTLPNIAKEAVDIIETYEEYGRLHPGMRIRGLPKVKSKIWQLLRDVSDMLDDSFSHVTVLEPTRLRLFKARVDKKFVICKIEFVSNYTLNPEGVYIRRQRVLSKCFQGGFRLRFIQDFVDDEKARIELYYIQKVAYSIVPDISFVKYLEGYFPLPPWSDYSNSTATP